jgi:uncharacterized protein (TIGR00255 family)
VEPLNPEKLMIYSMTAFARCTFLGDIGRYTWEIRSVNHRYAEIYLRIPEDLRAMESDLRNALLKRIKRGKIDCNLRVTSNASSNELVVNETTARALLEAATKLSKLADRDTQLDMLEVLKWPGVLEIENQDTDAMSIDVRTAFNDAVKELVNTRQREGGVLAGLVLERCDGIAVQIAALRTRVPEIITLTHERYRQRIQEYAKDLDKARIEQECALLMQKLDIAEELDRLEAHLEEVRRVLKQGSPAGRRLDFLMQELNREANTIGSKSAHIDSSTASVELKVLIEQIREQIQNIE